MKILLTIHHRLDPHSGAPGSVLKLGHIYRELGHQVQFYSFDSLSPTLPDSIKGTLFPEFFARDFLLRLRREQFDIVDASTGDAWVWGSLAHRWHKKVPLLVTRSHGLEHAVHEQILEDARQGRSQLSWKYPLYHGGFRLWEVATSLRCADLVFLLNRLDLKYVTEELGVDPDRTQVCPNGIPDAFLNLPFEPMPTDSSKFGIAVIGNYIQRKGIEYSVPALNAVLQRYPQVFVSFLGTGCPNAQVHAEFTPAVRDRVTVIPRFDHTTLPDLLQGHYIKLFAPLTEGFGKALIEAMACGLAPITTAAAGPLEIVRDRHDAIVVPLRDSNAIEHALTQLITDPPYLDRLRHNAYRTAQHYSWMQCAQTRLALYETALERKRTT